MLIELLLSLQLILLVRVVIDELLVLEINVIVRIGITIIIKVDNEIDINQATCLYFDTKYSITDIRIDCRNFSDCN